MHVRKSKRVMMWLRPGCGFTFPVEVSLSASTRCGRDPFEHVHRLMGLYHDKWLRVVNRAFALLIASLAWVFPGYYGDPILPIGGAQQNGNDAGLPGLVPG